MEKIIDNEIINSAKETIRNRLTNSLYGTFIISWLVFHWNFVFSIFFLDSDKILQVTGLLKNEYLLERYFNINDWYFWFSWIAPFILTYIIIWKLPKLILLRAYDETEKYEIDKKIIKISQQRRIEQEEVKLQEQTTKKVTAVAKQVLEQKKIKDIDPTIKWEEEFSEFKTKSIFNNFPSIIRSIYEHDGFIEDGMVKIPTSMLVYGDTNDLFKKIAYNKIELTPKGKFFVKKYNENLGGV